MRVLTEDEKFTFRISDVHLVKDQMASQNFNTPRKVRLFASQIRER